MIFDIAATMKNKQSLVLFITFTVCFVSSSEGYGIDKFSQSFSSSSASSHASSHSSSSSYTYNSVQNPGKFGFIHRIPKANAVASASATAGLATATVNATASAHVGGGADSHYDTFGSGGHSTVEGDLPEVTVNSEENIKGISHPYTHGATPDISLNDGSKSVRHHYSSATANTHASSGSYSYSEKEGAANGIGEVNHSAGGSSLVKHGPVLFKPVENGYTSSSGFSSSKSKDDSDQHNRGFNYQIVPNKDGSNSRLGTGSYSTSQSTRLSNNRDSIRSGTYSPKQGYQNFPETTTQRSDSSSSSVGQIIAKEENDVLIGSTHTYNSDKNILVNFQKTGGYSNSDSGSYSSQSSSSPSRQFNHVSIVSSTSAPSHQTFSGKGDHAEDGSYSVGDYNSPIDGDDGSYSYQEKPKIDFGSGPYLVVGGNTAANRETASHSSNKYVGGSYHIAGNGNEEKESSYSTAGSTVSAASNGQTNSSEKKYFHQVDEASALHQKNGYSKEDHPISQPHKHVFPGPDGSIYDYKVPSSQSNIHTSQSSLVQSGNYAGSQSVTFAGNIVGRKHCCKGPFPGPPGSIHDSKPASSVGTGVKTIVSHPPLTRVTPKTPIINNFPGSTGSIYTSKPVVTNIDNNHQNNNQWSTSKSSGTYQRIPGSSSLRLPLCTTSSPCTNAPQLTQQTTPPSYSKQPMVHNMYVNNIDKKAHNQIINEYIASQYPIPSPGNVGSLDEKSESQKPDITKPNPEQNRNAQNTDTALSRTTTNQQIGDFVKENETNNKSSFSLGVTHSQSTLTGLISSDVHNDIHPQIPENYHNVPNFMGVKQEFSTPPLFIVGEQQNDQRERNNLSSFVGYTQYHDQNVSDRNMNTHKTVSVLNYDGDNEHSNIESRPTYTVDTEFNIDTHQKPSASVTFPHSRLLPSIGQNGKHTIKDKQSFHGNVPSHGTSFYSTNSKTLSMSGNTISGDSQFTSSDKPIDITTTIEKQVPNVYTNSDEELILNPVGTSTIIEKQVPKVHTYPISDGMTNPVAVPKDFEMEKPKTHTSSVYIDFKKPFKVIDSDSIIFEKPASFSFDKNAYHFVGSGSHGLVDQHGGSGIAFSSSGSNSYGSSSRGYTGNVEHSCGNPSCGTSYRQYSNAVPSQAFKTSVFPIDIIPSSGYWLRAGSGSSAGSFGASTQVGSDGYSSSGSNSGVFPNKKISSEDGSGGFLSSIYIHNTPIHSSYADSHAKAGSFSTSKSFSKANAYASSSSYASSSAGSYTSHRY